MSYARFLCMIVVSTAVMYGAMYLNTFEVSHIFYSETQLYMALVMGSIMAVIMILFMWKMYNKTKLNYGILAGSTVLFSLSLWLVRSQATIDDRSYMSAMIPHHSIAILTSSRAKLRDPRTRDLADRILQAQVKEIEEMRGLIEDLDVHPIPNNAPEIDLERGYFLLYRGPAAPRPYAFRELFRRSIDTSRFHTMSTIVRES